MTTNGLEREGQSEPALPEQTRDDTEHGWGERPDDDGVEHYLRERPPHHGD